LIRGQEAADWDRGSKITEKPGMSKKAGAKLKRGSRRDILPVREGPMDGEEWISTKEKNEQRKGGAR